MSVHSVLFGIVNLAGVSEGEEMRVEKAAVLGSGTMGAQIAAHLANAGVPTLLLDIPPRELTPEEQAKGLKLDSPQVKNRIARGGLEAAVKAKPAAFFTPDFASLVTPGNFDDDLPKIKDCDLIIEAVVENLEIKRSLFERVEQYRRPGSIVASNTSGIPIHLLAEGRSDDFKQHFLGVHFFNPPRYLHLVEIIRTEWTKPEVSCFVYGFLDQRLGKGVVPAKDRPNFIANRIGTFGALFTIKTMLDDGYSIEEVDKMTGPAVGRPKSATFRTFDLVGLDVFTHVIKNLYEALPEDEEREMFVVPEVLATMVQRGLLGNKTKAGFYKKQKGEGDKREIWALDTATLDYRPSEKVKLPSLDMAKNIEDLPERIKTLTWGKDRAGAFLWKTLSRTLVYAAKRIPEIADNVVEVDRAMRWGFGWELGPFEVWDAIGVEKSVARMKEEGLTVPANVEQMLASGATSFYKKENGQQSYFDFASGKYVPLTDQPGVLILKVDQGTHGRDQEERRRFVDRHRRRCCVSRVSLENERDWRRHASDVEVCTRGSREKLRRSGRRQSGRELLRRRKHHVDVDGSAGGKLGRARHDGRAFSRTRR